MGDASERSFNWLHWTVIGCVAWLVFVVATGSSAIGIISDSRRPGPIGGWLIGGLLFLLAGLIGRRT